MPVPRWQLLTVVSCHPHGRDSVSCSLLGRHSPGWLCSLSPVPWAQWWLLTNHGQRADAGLHRALVLLLQPRTLQQPHGGLEKLHHDGLVGLEEAGVSANRVLGGSWLSLCPPLPPCPCPVTCSEVLFSEKGELKKALMVSSTTVSTYFSSVASGRRFSRFLHICEHTGRALKALGTARVCPEAAGTVSS